MIGATRFPGRSWLRRVKHLNPRQGITTLNGFGLAPFAYNSVKHLNPRQGITTSMLRRRICDPLAGVKHLNPRQGITTEGRRREWKKAGGGVKHLNPRQGITTCEMRRGRHSETADECETPKSPPGDYNAIGKAIPLWVSGASASVKHLNPRQGITTRPKIGLSGSLSHLRCETPKSPPGDYNSLPWLW